MKEKIGVIDIGSNTIRLVLYEKSIGGSHYKELENIKRTTRLRNYLDEQHVLKKEGISLLMETLKSFQMMIELYRITEVICVATAAIRQAKNRDSIIQMLQERIGITVNILSEYEEAYYGYLAVVNSIDITEGITIDMGGGSTELTYFCDRKLVHYISLPFGALSLKSQFVKGDIPVDEELWQIRDYLRSQFDRIPWIANKQIPIIAMGGSARNVAQIHQCYIKYPLTGIHQYEMKASDIHEMKESMEGLSYFELQNLEGLSKDRKDTILPAIEVFDLLCGLTKAPHVIFSRRGLRDGVLYSKQNRAGENFVSLADSNIHELIQDYHLDLNKCKTFSKIAAMFFEQIKGIKGIGNDLTEKDLKILKSGACIFHLGQCVNEESSSHTFHFLSNRTIHGFSHPERVKLALVASYKGKGAFRQYLEPFKNWYTKEERKKLCLLGAILTLSQSLIPLGRNNVHNLEIIPSGDSWVMNIHCHDQYAPEQYQLEKQKKHIEKLLKIKLVPRFHLIHNSKTKSQC